MYLLDSNVCIRLLNQSHARASNRYRAESPRNIALCSIVKAELLYGARRSRKVESNLRSLAIFFEPLASLPFDDRCTEEAARIRADLATLGRPIGPHDVLIAAIALAHDAVLVTHNVGEFSRVSGLRLEDWEE